MMQERDVEVDPSTIMRWVHRYAPELEKRVRAYQGYGSTSWRVDETYPKVGGRWKYLFRAVDKHGLRSDKFGLWSAFLSTVDIRPMHSLKYQNGYGNPSFKGSHVALLS